MVWDIAHTGTMTNNGLPYLNPYGSNLSGLNKPLYEFAPNEIVHSLKWHQNKSIICGMNNKHIKIIDLREDIKPKCVITKGVNGIALDPGSNCRFATFSDASTILEKCLFLSNYLFFMQNMIFVWDTRYMENPMTNITEVSNIVKLEWCPTRSNILAALLKDTNSIRLYEYQYLVNSKIEPEPSIVAREISPFSSKCLKTKVQLVLIIFLSSVSNPQIISSFSWHPHTESRMAVISTNSIIKDFKVIDRITLVCEVYFLYFLH